MNSGEIMEEETPAKQVRVCEGTLQMLQRIKRLLGVNSYDKAIFHLASGFMREREDPEWGDTWEKFR